MKYYRGVPIVLGKLLNKSNLIARCPYCSNIEYFSYGKSCANPTRRMSHCKGDFHDYYYIYIKKQKEVKQDGRESDV